MGFPIGKILNVAARVLGAILTAVPAIEAFSKRQGGGSGADKKAAVLELVQAELAAAELLLGRDLADDTDVLEAAGKINDAVVAFHKVLARKAASAAGS